MRKGGDRRAGGEGEVPEPMLRFRHRPELERDAAEDEGEQHDDHRQIECRHDHAIGLRESDEETAAAEDQPGLVAVPERRDRGHHRVPVGFLRPRRKEDADPEIEAVEDHVHGDRGGDEEGPDHRQIGLHLYLPRIEVGAGRAAVSGRFGTPVGGGASGDGPFRMRRFM